MRKAAGEMAKVDREIEKADTEMGKGGGEMRKAVNNSPFHASGISLRRSGDFLTASEVSWSSFFPFQRPSDPRRAGLATTPPSKLVSRASQAHSFCGVSPFGAHPGMAPEPNVVNPSPSAVGGAPSRACGTGQGGIPAPAPQGEGESGAVPGCVRPFGIGACHSSGSNLV